MADTTAIKAGTADGDPAPILSDNMINKFLQPDAPAREELQQIVQKVREAGDFDATVNGFRYTKKDMSEAAWKIYGDIMGAEDPKALSKLFVDEMDVKNILDGRKVRYLNEIQAEATGLAIKELTDKYLGKEITEASARAMDTTGREIATISEAFQKLPETADETRVMDMIADKLTYLTHEYGMNKYISGWQLKMKDKWSQAVKEGPDAVQAITMQFDQAVKLKKEQALAFNATLKQLRRDNPAALRPLIEAFALTKGDVTNIQQLKEWANSQITPLGLLKSNGHEGLNAFAQGLWAVRYNNVLSGLSALRAGVGNASQLILKPMNAMIGAGIESMFSGSMKPVKRAWYTYNSVFETNKRALGEFWTHFKNASNNPEDYMSMSRPDLMQVDNQLWDTLDGMSKVWEKEGDTGKLFMYNWAKLNKEASMSKWMRYGTNAMIGVDAYTTSALATATARAKAWDEVMGTAGTFNAKLAKEAETKAYRAMFDANGFPVDAALKHASGEVALSLDDELASSITQLTTKVPALKPFFMFPRTGINSIKMAMSYTPVAMLPGMKNTHAILTAGDDVFKIGEALALHGINPNTPNFMEIYQGLRAEYRGRIAMGALITGGVWGYAMSGNVRGNGPVNASERKKMKDMGWKEKTINVGGKWVSYAGIEPLDTILSLIGDVAYYSRDVGSSVTQDMIDKIAWTVSATFTNKTFMAGLEPLVAIANGDETAMSRFLAQEVRAYIPLSGAMGVASNAITSSQKDIYKDFMGYIQNKVPGFSSMLPEQIDIWTGKPINDIDNPALRALNAVNPVPISDGMEPWRQWLLETGWDGMSMIRRDSSGSYEYQPKEREILYKYMGEQGLYKEVEKLMKSPRMNDQLNRLRAYRAQGWDSERIRLEAKDLELYKRLDDIITDGRKKAEMRLQAGQPCDVELYQEYPHLKETNE